MVRPVTVICDLRNVYRSGTVAEVSMSVNVCWVMCWDVNWALHSLVVLGATRYTVTRQTGSAGYFITPCPLTAFAATPNTKRTKCQYALIKSLWKSQPNQHEPVFDITLGRRWHLSRNSQMDWSDSSRELKHLSFSPGRQRVMSVPSDGVRLYRCHSHWASILFLFTRMNNT